jgi:hypothetical protein
LWLQFSQPRFWKWSITSLIPLQILAYADHSYTCMKYVCELAWQDQPKIVNLSRYRSLKFNFALRWPLHKRQKKPARFQGMVGADLCFLCKAPWSVASLGEHGRVPPGFL